MNIAPPPIIILVEPVNNRHKRFISADNTSLENFGYSDQSHPILIVAVFYFFLDLPEVTEQSKNDFKNLPVIRKGDDVRLECKAQGNPVTTYYVWRWENGTVIQNKTTGILEFKNIQPYEGGRLSCAGGSYIGEGEKVQVKVFVRGEHISGCM